MKPVLIAIILSFPAAVCGQQALHNSHWEGELPSTIKYTIAFHFRNDSAGVLKGTMDSPGQGTFGIAVSNIQQSGDSIFLNLNGIKAVLEGRLEADGQRITARWKQGSVVTPLILQQKQWPVVYDKVKIQTPAAPFAYESVDVEYAGGDSTVRLAGTITRPRDNNAGKKFPAIILISGSGPQDRDETMMGHKPFAVLADYLTRRGYLVLRYDDRGTGRSTGKFNKATSADFATDAEASFNYLLQRGDVDVKHIGLLGHSEGGMIAPMVAARRREIAFVILMAGPGLPVLETMAAQNQALLEASGYKKEAAASYRNMYVQLLPAVINAGTDSAAIAAGAAVVNQWRQTEPAAVVTPLTGIPETSTPEKFVKPFVAQLRTPWWKYFLQYNPGPVLEQLSCKVLAINGSRDIQVLPENLAAIERALKKAAVKRYAIQTIEGVNHLFQECYYCVVGEYGALQQTLSPKALEVIGAWLKREVQ